MKLPSRIFAYWSDEDKDRPFMVASDDWEDLAEAGEKRLVGEYRLVDRREVELKATWKAPEKR